jgi:nucleoside-diphosphate-sugar epimerase
MWMTCAGLLAAGERGTGATYVLSGEDASINQFAALAAQYAGVRAPRLRISRGLALLAGSMCDVATRLSGRRLPLSREGVLSGTRERWLHSHELATRELGWEPRPLAAGLPPTVRHILEAA